MISAVSGSNATALLALFGRSQTDATPNPSAAVAASQPPPPLPQGNGATAQSLFDALVHAGHGGKDDADKSPLDQIMSGIFSSLDADGDGKLSPDELKSAFATFTGTANDGSDQPQTSSTGGANSLYESLFNAMATDDGSPGSATRKDDLVKKFLSLLDV